MFDDIKHSSHRNGIGGTLDSTIPKARTRHRRANRIDLALLVLVNAVCLWSFLQIDVLQSLHQAAHDYEFLGLHAVVPLFFTLSVTLAIYAWRRWQASVQMADLAESMALTDPLTKLLNRRALEVKLQQEYERMLRTGSVFSVILLDIDDFKAVNDTFGHSQGDDVLVEVAHKLSDNTRNMDSISRWGGEEFLLLCSDTNITQATHLAEKLRQKIECVLSDDSVISVSMGVASANAGEPVSDLLQRVDDALYQAKHRGKNRVVQAH